MKSLAAFLVTLFTVVTLGGQVGATTYPIYPYKYGDNYYSMKTLNSDKFRKRHRGGYTKRSSNTYAAGHCTFYVMGTVRWVKNIWGDAKNWDTNAVKWGHTRHAKPKIGSIAQSDKGEFGHVAVVTQIYPDGKIRVSEMNWYEKGVVDSRVTWASSWEYIYE